MKLNDKMNEMEMVVRMKDLLQQFGYTYEQIKTFTKYVEDNKT